MNRLIAACLFAVMAIGPGGYLLAQETVSLIAPANPTAGWKINNGQEFPGAVGGLTVDSEAKREGTDSLKLVGDFTKGGKYVEAGRKIDGVDIRELAMWVRSPGGDRFTLRLNDASGQTHQIAMKLEPTPGLAVQVMQRI